MKFFVLILAVCVSLTSIDAQTNRYSKRKMKIKKKPTLTIQNKKTLNPDAFTPQIAEPILPEPAPEPILAVEPPAPEPQPVPVAEEEQKYSDIGFVTALGLTMHHMRGTDVFDLPFKLTSGIGFGAEAEVSYNFMKNAGVFIRGGLDTLKYKNPDGFVMEADKSLMYNGRLGVRMGQNYIVGGELYYGFIQNLYYYSRNNTTGYMSRASNSLFGAKAMVNILNSEDYGLLFALGGNYMFGGTRSNFVVKKSMAIVSDIDFKIGVTETLFVLTGFTFEYRKACPETQSYSEYYGMLKLGFGRK